MAQEEVLLDQFAINTEVRVIALVGAGGKTSLMYALAHEILARNLTVITTTTTKIFPPPPDQSPCLLFSKQEPDLRTLKERLKQFKHVTVGSSINPRNGKLEGMGENALGSLALMADKVIVEADGAAGRCVKAPETWEPVIPTFCELVIPIIGLDCIGRSVHEDVVFRISRFMAVTGLNRGDIITPESIAKLLTSDHGALKGVHPDSKVIPFLNKLDLLKDSAAIETILKDVAKRKTRINRIVVGRLKNGAKLTSFVV